LLDPEIMVKPTAGQIDDLIAEIRTVVSRGERVLVTTLTKRKAEDLTEYLGQMDIRVRYLHSEIDSLDRVEILRALRLHEFDVLVGINLLREGLDLPEVSLVAILDADREGFLQSERSLMQVAGRAARHLRGRVIMYADRITPSMEKVLRETERRRKIQEDFNRRHGIVPRSIVKSDAEIRAATGVVDTAGEAQAAEKTIPYGQDAADLAELQKEMARAAEALDFERAARLRDRIFALAGETFSGQRKPRNKIARKT